MSANKRVEVTAPGEKLQIVDGPIPDPPPHGLVVKSHYSGICHSDVHSWQDKWRFSNEQVLSITDFIPDYTFPAVIGHEVSGEVHSLGKDYQGELSVGDCVAVYPWCGCEACDKCKAGDQRVCAKFSEYNIGIGADGGFQQYIRVAHGRYVFRAAPSIPMDVLSLMSCSGLTALNAVLKLQPSVDRAIKHSGVARVLVIGAGGLGIWAIKWAKAIFPPTTKVYVADISEEKLSGAMEQGADESVLWDRAVSDDDLIAKTREQSEGGLDGTIDLVGIPATSYKAVMSLKMGGTCSLAGLAGGTARLPLMHVILEDITICGILAGSTEHMQQQMKIYVDKKVPAPPITHVQPEDVERCLLELQAGTFQGRYVIDWTTHV